MFSQQHSFQVMISKSFPQTHKVVLLSYPFANLTCLFVQISISKTSWPRQIQGVWSRHHGGLGQARSPRLGGDIYFDAGERWAGDKCSPTTKNKYHRRLNSHVLAFWKLFLPALPELHRQTIELQFVTFRFSQYEDVFVLRWNCGSLLLMASLHQIGLAIGLNPSRDPQSVMFPLYR